MSKCVLPKGYVPVLTTYQTQSAIGRLKRVFEDSLSMALNLHRVSAPLIVEPWTGLNDDLSGVERPVEFGVTDADDAKAQIVQSLAKWKRQALHKYGFPAGTGLYTDMNAIRRDEILSNVHSVYVDQWDWELVMTEEQRTLDYLKQTVRKIVETICAASERLRWDFPKLPVLNPDVTFLSAQELEDRYGDLTPDQREGAAAKEHKTIFVIGVGGKLKSGQSHGMRAPDYDDWALNGDIVFWHDTLGRAMEISSMGIRVDAKALDAQLTKAGCDNRRSLPFHKALLSGALPLTIGGGIGQSRLCMLVMAKAHIGEVQVSVWDKDTHDICRAAGVTLL